MVVVAPAGAAACDGVDDAERVEEHVDDVHHQQKEHGRRQQRKDDGPEPAQGTGAVNGGGFQHAFRNRLKPGEEEQEVVGNLLPDRGHHNEGHGVIAVEQRIPVKAEGAQRRASVPSEGWNMKIHSTPAIAGATA